MMLKMKAILIDDEPLALKYLEHQLVNLDNFQVVGKFTDSLAGKQAVETTEVDIVFLDIHIPEMNGMELAERLLESKPELPIVFVTAYDEFAIRAFELNALDYLLKPVRQERLSKTIERIKQSREEEKAHPSFPQAEKLHINMFHQVTISDGKQIKELHWRTTKVQQLFLYLLHHRGEVVDKSALIELLWSDYEFKKAYAQLYTSIYHIRKTLEPFGPHFKIKNMQEGYMLTLEDIVLDVEEFERVIQLEYSLSEETIADYEQALNLFTGEYLQGCDYLWAEGERQRLQSLWITTSLNMVNWYCSHNNFEKAMKHCWDICQRYPLEEEANFFLMRIFATIGNRSSVDRQYCQLKEVLREELNELPSPSITKWYTNWKENKGLSE